MEKIRELPIHDMLPKDGKVRPEKRMVHEIYVTPGRLRPQGNRSTHEHLEAWFAALERRLASALLAKEQCAQIAAIPGVGLLTATVAVAAIGEARTFRTGRQFSAWVGLVPRHVGVAVAALVNKLARTIWAVLARERPYDPVAFNAVRGAAY